MSILRNYDIYSIEERIHNLEMGGSPTPGGGSWDYSTDEVDTHQKWIDGKTIYCRVISGTFNFPASQQPLNITSVTDIDTIVDVRAVANQGGTNVASCNSPIVYVDNGTLVGVSFTIFNAKAIILFYTKTEPTKSTKRSKK